MIRFLLALLLLPGPLRAEKISFAREILPLLSENCFFCHGPDPETREADLRLDLLGIDHTALTYKHQGRHFRLTDVHGHPVTQVLA